MKKMQEVFVKCGICKKKLKMITHTHLKFHNLKVNDYKKLFPDAKILSKRTEYILRKNSWSKQSDPEINEKRRESVLKWIKNNPEKFRQIYEIGKRKHSEETKKKISLAQKGKHYSSKTEFKRGHKVLEKWRESYRKKLYKRLENDEYRIELNKKRLTACGFKPNKKELFLNSLIQSNFPNQWKYVGNGEVVLGAGCPDWINVNGQKKVILHHGIYWHLWRLQKLRDNLNLTKQDIEREDTENYKKYGFDALIIWEDELKNSQQIIERIKNF